MVMVPAKDEYTIVIVVLMLIIIVKFTLQTARYSKILEKIYKKPGIIVRIEMWKDGGICQIIKIHAL
jgi:hypothetical protein